MGNNKELKNGDTPSVVLIGAGNLATHLGKALSESGVEILQVYSRTEQSAGLLAEKLNVPLCTQLDQVDPTADLYIVSLKDDAFSILVPEIVSIHPDALFVHTAGSLPMDIWKGHCTRYGVFYPLQTFSKKREVDFSGIPLLIEAHNTADYRILERLGKLISGNVMPAGSKQREALHVAAVFACNFTNYMYWAANRILKEHDLPFEILLPLIKETAYKVESLTPEQAQTGPAVRYDVEIINKHLDLLKSDPDLQELYQQVSQGIYKRKK